MPVHRHQHDKAGSVYAFRTELDSWLRSRRGAPIDDGPGSDRGPAVATAPLDPPHRRRDVWALAAIAGILFIGLALWSAWKGQPPSPERRLTDARFVPLTNFGGNEQAAAISRDGRFAAFVSNREGTMDVWVTQIGSGQFHNLTQNTSRELINPSVRTLGFSPDGSQVTFWARTTDGSGQAGINIWAVPILGGSARPYLEGAAEYDWSADGARLVYHTPGPGDPLFVREPNQPARKIFSAPAGLHGHFPIWSPDSRFIYFVQGSLPDRMDVWRLPAAGGTAERITHHDAHVSHPVFADSRTLLYLATDATGLGPSLHSLAVDERKSHRVSFGLERYTSLSASSDGRRLVATVAGTKGTLWRVPMTGARIDSPAALQRITLTTGSGSFARSGPGYLLYVSSKGETDSLWKLEGHAATELWSAPDTRIIGAPAIARDGRRIAFSTRHDRQTSLYVANADGTNARILTGALELNGSPAWAPDGQSITVSALSAGMPRLFSVLLDGGSVSPLGNEHAIDPVWSPDGELAVYSGPDVGTTFPIKAVNRSGSPFAVPDLTLSRGSRRLAFLPGGRWLVFLRGDIGHKNIWTRDLQSGAERQLTHFGTDFSIRDFDISPDGRELILEQLQERSDVVLIEIRDR